QTPQRQWIMCDSMPTHRRIGGLSMNRSVAFCATSVLSLALIAGCKNNSTTATSSTGPANSSADASQQAANGPNAMAPQSNTAPAAAPAPAPQPVVIPTGTTLSVTLSGPVSSKTSQTGEEFHGNLAEAVVVGDSVAIPRGANVAGVVREAHSAGKFKG